MLFLIVRSFFIRPQLLGSTEIINHLFETYGPGKDKIPNNLKSSGQGIATVKTGGKGTSVKSNARPDNTSMKSITLFGWEGAPYVKQVILKKSFLSRFPHTLSSVLFRFERRLMI
jgi:hypothetical protein